MGMVLLRRIFSKSLKTDYLSLRDEQFPFEYTNCKSGNRGYSEYHRVFRSSAVFLTCSVISSF